MLPEPTYSVAPSKAGVESDPQPLNGSSQPSANFAVQTGVKSEGLRTYRTPSLAVAATSFVPSPVWNKVGEEPQSLSPKSDAGGRKKYALISRDWASKERSVLP